VSETPKGLGEERSGKRSNKHINKSISQEKEFIKAEIDKGAMSARITKNILQKEEAKKIPLVKKEVGGTQSINNSTKVGKLGKSKSVKGPGKMFQSSQISNVKKEETKLLEVTAGRITLNSLDQIKGSGKDLCGELQVDNIEADNEEQKKPSSTQYKEENKLVNKKPLVNSNNIY